MAAWMADSILVIISTGAYQCQSDIRWGTEKKSKKIGDQIAGTPARGKMSKKFPWNQCAGIECRVGLQSPLSEVALIVEWDVTLH